MNTETAPGGRRLLDLSNWLEPQARLCMQPVNHIHHRHLVSLLSPKADTHFVIPRRVEGCVNVLPYSTLLVYEQWTIELALTFYSELMLVFGM